MLICPEKWKEHGFFFILAFYRCLDRKWKMDNCLYLAFATIDSFLSSSLCNVLYQGDLSWYVSCSKKMWLLNYKFQKSTGMLINVFTCCIKNKFIFRTIKALLLCCWFYLPSKKKILDSNPYRILFLHRLVLLHTHFFTRNCCHLMKLYLLYLVDSKPDLPILA